MKPNGLIRRVLLSRELKLNEHDKKREQDE